VQQEIKYTVYFNGYILPEFELEAVKEDLTKLFEAQLSDVGSLFNGECIFQRSGLNKFTADQYSEKFKRIGAMCHVVQDSDKSNFNLCPKCHSSNINTEQCLDCGIYLKKIKLTRSTCIDNSATTSSGDNEVKHFQDMHKATTIIKFVIIYLLFIFTADNFLQDNKHNFRYIVGTGFEFGVYPYILGNIGLAYGCYFLALAKGRSGIWGVSGLASLPGLSILLLLSNTRSPNQILPDGKTKIFAISLLLLSAYWATNYIKLYGVYSQFIEKSVILREQRHEYPVNIFDSDPDLYLKEIEELEVFLDEGFNLLSTRDFKYAQISAIAETMFSETSRLFIWIHYQQYLKYKNGNTNIDLLNKTKFTDIQKIVFVKIQNAVRAADLDALNQLFEQWFLIYDAQSKGFDFLSNFYRGFYELEKKIIYSQMRNNRMSDPVDFSFEALALPSFPGIKVVIEGDKILFDFSEHAFPATNKTLVIASFYQPYNTYSGARRNPKTKYRLAIVQISPNFPNKYFSTSSIGVFKGFGLF